MPPTETSPLLASRPDNEDETERATHAESSENTPLLPSDRNDDEQEPLEEQPTSWSLWGPAPSDSSSSPDKSSRWRWPSIIAGIVLAILVVLLLVGGFVVPGAVKEYAERAAVVEPKALSVESITSGGVTARIQANVRLDGSRVKNADTRRIGRFATGIMKRLETGMTRLDVSIPSYNISLLGSAMIPPITVDIRDGHSTDVDIVTDLIPGDVENFKDLANTWLDGKLDKLKVIGAANIQLRSGIFPLGSHDVMESMVFEASKIPSIPEYHIERINFQDVPLGPDGRKAVGANVSLSLFNKYPIALDIPPLGFDILLANCDSSDPFITVAEATTNVIEVQPDSKVHAGALGIIREIPKNLTRSCPKSKMSPLDVFMSHYLHGEDAKVFVRGGTVKDSDTPEWIEDILKSITVPVEFPGQSFGHAIRNFSATDVDFKLPSPFADPKDPDGVPRVSGTILVLAALPDQLNLDLGVHNIKSNADLFYKGDKLGELNMHEWNEANSTMFNNEHNETMINITSHIVDVPLDVTNNSVFTDIMQKMFFGGDDIVLNVKASVDVQVGTVLGDLALKGIPANGSIPVKGMPKDTFATLQPLVDEVRILNTSQTRVTMQARVNFTNPTPYTAFVPALNIHLLAHDQVLGEATATNVSLTLGNNTGNIIEATWDPLKFSGSNGTRIGRHLLSNYLSGKNTTLGIRTHRGSIPSMPALGEALSKINITIPTPHLGLPGDGDNDTDGSRFIRDATFHLFSSTATFTLASPLRHNTVYLEAVNATAYYNHTEPIGQITTDQAFPAPPGLSRTPKLPVEWSPSRIGYDKLKEALGGGLKLDAVADVTVRVGRWVEEIHYTGKGIGAKVTL